MTDNRTNEPTEAQVEAAAKALYEAHTARGDADWKDLREATRKHYQDDSRAALVAAYGAAPQAERDWRLDVVPEPWTDHAQALSSSGVDEGALIREAKAEALEDAARAFDGGTISLDVFSNEVEKSYWRVANEQRSILVDSLRARAEASRQERGEQ